MRFRPPSSMFTIFYCSRAMFRSITRSETLAMQAILIVVFATHIKTLTTRGVDSGRRKRESVDKKTWLGHAALSCDYNARNWKTGRENYLKLKWIVFPFSRIVTLPVLLLMGPLQQVIHVIQNRHTGKQEKQWGKASYIYVNYYDCCIILFVFMQVCRVWDIVTFFCLNFVTVTCVV